MIHIYNFFLYAAAVILLPFIVLLLILKPSWRKGLSERAGRVPEEFKKKTAGKRIIWFHAASVGEAAAVVPVIREIKRMVRGCAIIATSTSLNGKKKLIEDAGKETVFVSVLPLEFGFVMRHFIRKIKPDMAVIVETELWPNLINSARREKVPLVLINGRISAKSFRIYSVLKFLFGPLLSGFALLVMQNEKVLKRMESLGADAGKMVILNNTKYSARQIEKKDKAPAVDKNGKVIIVAGSIRPSEEKAVIRGCLKKGSKKVTLIIAPRHLERVREIIKTAEEERIGFKLWTEIKGDNIIPELEMIIVDTIGELDKIYHMGDIAVIGGGFGKYGGHNPMEAAYAGLPMIMGKRMVNFEDTSARFVKSGGAIEAEPDENEIGGAVRKLAGDESLRKKMGRINAEIIEKFRGTAETTAVLLAEILYESKEGGENVR